MKLTQDKFPIGAVVTLLLLLMSVSTWALEPQILYSFQTGAVSVVKVSDLARQPNEGVAHAYTRTVAELSHQYMPYIRCIDTESDHNWPSMGFFTAAGLDNAIKSTAGLIRQFIEEVDKTPPTITISQPAATNYLHTGTLTLNWALTDDESGVKLATPLLDGATTLNGHGLASGQTINLLTELSAGDHTFTVTAVDNATNSASATVTFSIVVTAQSIIDDVTFFLSSGAITQHDATSFFKKLKAAADYRAAGDCKDAADAYLAFINELNALAGKKVTQAAAAIMIADAQYLIAHCP